MIRTIDGKILPQAENYIPETHYMLGYGNNPYLNAKDLDKFLCNTIEESIKSIDKALEVRDYGDPLSYKPRHEFENKKLTDD